MNLIVSNLGRVKDTSGLGEITPEMREGAAALCSAAEYNERELGTMDFGLACDAVGEDIIGKAACLARYALWASPDLATGRWSWREAEAKILSKWVP